MRNGIDFLGPDQLVRLNELSGCQTGIKPCLNLSNDKLIKLKFGPCF